MSLIPVKVQYHPTNNAITFSGPTVKTIEDGTRAVIEVEKSKEEREILLNLSGGEAIFPGPDQAVQWRDGKPRWVPEVLQLSPTVIQIKDDWQENEEKAASFIVNVVDGGVTYPSKDPTIVNDPENP